MFALDDMNEFCERAKKLIKPVGHSHVVFKLQFSSWWRRLWSLREEKEVLGDEDGEEVGIKEYKVFDVDQTLLFYTRAHSHYQQSPRSRSLNHTNVLEQADHFWWKGTSFLDVIHNFDYDPPVERRATHSGWTNLLFNIL